MKLLDFNLMIIKLTLSWWLDKKERRSFNGSYTFYSEKFTEIYKDIIIYTIVSILTDYSGLSSSQ